MVEEKRRGGESARTLALLAVTSLTIMAGASISPSLPAIRSTFAHTLGVDLLTRLLLTVTALMIAVSAPFVGWFLDRYGRKRVMMGSIVLYAVAGTSGYYLQSLVAVVVGRAILGIAVAGTLTAATTLVGDYYTSSQRNRVLGLQGAFSAAAGVVFLLLGGALAEVNWRTPFLMYAAALALFPVVARVLYEPSRDRGEHSPTTLPPMSRRTLLFVLTLYGVAFCVQIAFYTLPVHLPFYLIELGILRPSQAGIALSLMTLSAALVAVSFRWISRYIGRIWILSLSLALLGVGFAVLSYAHDFAGVVRAMVLCGVAMGANFPNLAGWLLGGTPLNLRGRIVGGQNTSIFLGQFFSPIATQPLTQAFDLSRTYASLSWFLVALALITVLAGLFGWLSARRRITAR